MNPESILNFLLPKKYLFALLQTKELSVAYERLSVLLSEKQRSIDCAHNTSILLEEQQQIIKNHEKSADAYYRARLAREECERFRFQVRTLQDSNNFLNNLLEVYAHDKQKMIEYLSSERKQNE